MDNKFFTLIKPYLFLIDKGLFYRKTFFWLYALLAIVNLILPILVLYYYFDNIIFEAPIKIVISFLIFWIIFAFASWVSFQILWNRRLDVLNTSAEGDEFVVMPVFSHFIQTLGEWLGTWIGFVGVGFILFRTIILEKESYYLSRIFGRTAFHNFGFLFDSTLTHNLLLIVLWIIYGYLIIVTTRFLAELIKSLSSIANNTKRN